MIANSETADKSREVINGLPSPVVRALLQYSICQQKVASISTPDRQIEGAPADRARGPKVLK